MTPIRLAFPLFIGDRHHERGEVALVPEARAAQLIREGAAERVEPAESPPADPPRRGKRRSR